MVSWEGDMISGESIFMGQVTLHRMALLLVLFLVVSGCLNQGSKNSGGNNTTPQTPDGNKQAQIPALKASDIRYEIRQNGEHEGSEEYTQQLDQQRETVLLAPVNKQDVEWKFRFSSTTGISLNSTVNSSANNGVQCEKTGYSNLEYTCKNTFTSSGAGKLEFEIYSATHCISSLTKTHDATRAHRDCSDLAKYPADSRVKKTLDYEAVDIDLKEPNKVVCAGLDAGAVGAGEQKNNWIREISGAVVRVFQQKERCQ